MSPTHHNQQQRRNSVTTNSSENEDGPWQCCTPLGCIYNNGSNAEHILITKEDLRAGQEVVVKVICSNEQCKLSPYMHTACFQTFEESVLSYLKGQGRAKSWSDRQKLQNLWTKKAYDLVFKACACNCSHGHLRKDLDWSQQSSVQVPVAIPTEHFHPIEELGDPARQTTAGMFAEAEIANGAAGGCANQKKKKKEK